MTTRSVLLTILNVLSAIIAIILGGRILFALVGANPSSPVVTWVNNISQTFLYPFSGLFQSIILNSRSAIDVTAIVALLVYALLFSFLYRLIYYLTHSTTISDTEVRHSHI